MSRPYSPVLGVVTCTKLIEKVMRLEKINDVRELRVLLQRTGVAGVRFDSSTGSTFASDQV